MEISQLQHFVVIANYGNFGRAAAELNVTQSALSKSVKRLETFLGAPLFERTTRGVHLTVFGKGLLDYARVIINERNRAIAMMSSLKGRAAGNLVIGVAKHLSGYVIPEAASRLLEANPGLWLEVTDGYFDDLTERLLSGELDLVFAGYKEQKHAPALVYEKLLESDSVIVARPGHPLAKKPTVTRGELMQARWVLPVEKNSIMQFYDSVELESGDFDQRALPILASAVSFGLEMVKRTDLIVISPRHTVAADLAAGKLVEIKGPIRKRSPNIGIIMRRKGFRSPGLIQFAAEIRNVCKKAG